MLSRNFGVLDVEFSVIVSSSLKTIEPGERVGLDFWEDGTTIE